jgi:phage gp29-like protein
MGLLENIGKRIAAIGRGPEQSKVAEIGLPYSKPPVDAKTEALLRSWGVYEGRLGPLAGPTKTRYSLWTADDLTPEKIINAQRQAVVSGIPLQWVEMIDQIHSRDGHYASCSGQRVADVIKGTWRLTPSAVTDAGLAASNFTDHAYRRTSRFSDGLGWLLFSNLYGFNGVEVEWEEVDTTFPGPKNETIRARVVLPRRLHNVHPKHFRFDLDTDDPMFWIGNGYQPLPPGKFVFMDGEGLHPIKVRRGHAWQCVWYSMFRSISWSGWATFVERFGMPVPILGYDGDLAQYGEYATAMTDVLNSLGTGNGFRYPKNNFTLDVKDPPRGGTSSDPHSALSDACDAGQSIRVLGGQLNNKIGNVGSFAASSNHLDVKYGLEELDAARMWDRIDEQLSAPLLQFNAEALAAALNAAGYNVTPDEIVRSVPRGKHHIPGKTDPVVEMEIMERAVKMGLPISKKGAFERMDLERARDDEDQIPGEAQVVGKGAALKTDKDAANPETAENPDEAALITAKAQAEKPPAGTQQAKQEP